MPFSTTPVQVGQSSIISVDRPSEPLRRILDELFRVAHQSDAYEIHVETFDDEGRPSLSVYDNGLGIGSPRTLLALDAFGWCETLPGSRNARGLALSSLTGRHTIVRSGPDETEPGWSVTIPPRAWTGEAPITIEPDGGLRGTNILVEIPDEWRVGLEDAVAAAARDLPVRVYFHARWKNRR